MEDSATIQICEVRYRFCEPRSLVPMPATSDEETTMKAAKVLHSKN
jgi:hypothetical protein